MSARAVARQYAHALFDVARKSGQIDRMEREITGFAEIVAGHTELGRVLKNPAIPAARKGAVVQALLERLPETSPEIGRTLMLLAERDRLMLLEAIVEAYRERAMDTRRVARAELVSAVPLAESSRQAVVAALGKAVDRELLVTERVEPALIGGLVARVGSVVFDGSVARHLERLRTKLIADIS